MAALDFPSSPATGATYAGGNGVVYTYNGTVWLATGASAGGDFYGIYVGANFTVGTTAITLPINTIITGNSGGWYATGGGSIGRYTPPAGRYRICAGLTWSSGAIGTCTISIRKNGVAVISERGGSPSGSFALVTVEGTFDANGSDYFETFIVNTQASADCLGSYFSAFPISGIKGPPGDPTPGTLMQTVSFQTGAVATGTTTIPADDTIPQITEGTEFLTCAITPKSATSKLVVDVTWNGSTSALGTLNLALFQDSIANALAAVSVENPSVSSMRLLTFRHTMTSGTTSATTFRVRAGNHTASTTIMNGTGGRMFGGVMASSIVIQEVAP